MILVRIERDAAKKQIDEIKDMFEGSITVVELLEGRVRQDNRAFFDWKDGISQPALECVVSCRCSYFSHKSAQRLNSALAGSASREARYDHIGLPRGPSLRRRSVPSGLH